jgi:predicted permease
MMVRSLQIALGTHPGFEFERLVSFDPDLSLHGYKGEAAAGYLEELRGRVIRMPGVETAALCTVTPFGSGIWTQSGAATVPGSEQPRRWQAYANSVDANYFRTMEIPLLRGRAFVSGEKRNVVIVSEALARSLWPGDDPLGKSLDGDGDTVVGVAGRTRTVAMSETNFEVYYPLQAGDAQSAALLVKTADPPEAHVETLRAAAQALDPKVMPTVTLVKESYRLRMQSAGHGAMVVSAMGLLAALLAATGVYGLVSYAVSQRQKEVGIRMALGAQPAHILTLVLRQFYAPVGAGIVIGMAMAAGLSVALRSMLFGMSNFDPLSYAAAILFFVVLAATAALVPARKALRVDPMEVLRYE